MFYPEREELLQNINIFQKRVCGYKCTPDCKCDCKYGATGVGEKTGCPELRTVIALLSKITDKQYNSLLGSSTNYNDTEFKITKNTLASLDTDLPKIVSTHINAGIDVTLDVKGYHQLMFP